MDDRKKLFILVGRASLCLGGILGVLSIIPFLNIFAILVLSVCSGALIIKYFQNKKIIGEITMKGGAVIGALVGVVVTCGFLVIAVPLFALISYVPFIPTNYNILLKYLWQLSFLIFPMMWIITAPLNAVGVVCYLYIRETLHMINNSEQNKEFKPDFFKEGKEKDFGGDYEK